MKLPVVLNGCYKDWSQTIKLTVIQTLPALDAGGVERGTLEVAAELVRRGHRSIVISTGGRLVKQLVDEGSEHITMPVGNKSLAAPLQISKVRRLLIETRASILHARSRLPAWISYLAWKGLDKNTRPRFITTVHGLYSVNPYSSIMTKGERVIAVSNTVSEYILENYPSVDPEKIEVIHRGLSSKIYYPDFRPSDEWLNLWNKALPGLKNKFIVTLPARITRLKGHEHFLLIIKSLVEEGIPVHGLVVGGVHSKKRRYRAELEKKSNDFGLQEHVSFIGHRDDLREIMSVSDVIMSLSQKPESFGRTVLESLCLGTAVVAYAHGGVGEIMDKLFPEGKVMPQSPKFATDRIIEFYRNPPVIKENNPFTLKLLLDKTITLYQNSLSLKEHVK
ncbi:MAG: glycosyltransferase [candidate division Zixibacteria bacterium]|nr:glycosyltransferase [Candidatus Dadabacteria bacterium]NIW45242.1 glycosyltransferase [Gammaproteobacteria bacterium]NIX56425.1 glycosyltransferase [candidate division Zixibacteria bacterium]